MKKCKILFVIAFVFIPSFSFAAFTGTTDLINAFGGILDSLFAVLVGLALAAFFWGLAKFVFRVGGDEKAVEDGKRTMLWGIIALFVMISIWGIINFIGEELDLNNSTTPNTPSGEDGGGFGSGLIST